MLLELKSEAKFDHFSRKIEASVKVQCFHYLSGLVCVVLIASSNLVRVMS